ADVNNDGRQDFIAANQSIVYLAMNDGNGNFQKVWQVSGLSGPTLAVGDMDNDGLLDLAVGGMDSLSQKNTLNIYRGMPGGGFSTTPTALSPGVAPINVFSPGMMAWADVNNDGWMDLVAAGNDDLNNRRLLIFINRPYGTDRSLVLEGQPYGTSGGVSGG